VQRILFYGGLTVLLAGGVVYATHMPGHSHTGELPPETASVRAAGLELETHVVALSAEIGEREVGRADSLTRARRYVEAELRKIPLPAGAQIEAESLGADGSDAENMILELPGERPDVVLIGAHYDSAPGTPGANDNASGVAVGLYLASSLATASAEQDFENTLRLVFFANEEPPYFQNPGMGALAHARGCAQRGEKIVAMLALESLGFYSEAPGSQRYPWPVGLFYPDRGNFVGFVGNLGSRSLVRQAIGSLRAHAGFPFRRSSTTGRHSGRGLVRSLGVLAVRLPGDHGHGHRRVS